MAEKIEQVGGDVPAPATKCKTNEPGTSGPQCSQLPTGDQQTQSDTRHNPALKAPITSKLDFVRFLDHFLPNLLLLSVVLGIESQAADILKDRSNATEKCLNILGMWLSVTANPTWELFCSLLQRHATFNHVRSLIEAGSCTLLALPGGQEQTKTLCDNPHIQRLKKHVTNRYKNLKHAESGVNIEYIQLALLEAQPDSHDHEEGSNKLQFLENFRKCGGKSGKVHSYITANDLLKPISGQNYGMKVVYGQAGIGKTTMLTHICRLLALSKMKSSYALVLYFPLRDKAMSSAKSLSDLLSYYASADLDLDLSALRRALVDCDDKEVLFIFDGADEVQDLLSSEERGVIQDLLEGKALPQADVIVSSRPGGLPQLKKQNVATFYEIHGFDAQSIEKYINELFKASPEKGERLWKELQSRDDLMGAAHIPMNLLIFCAILGDAHLPPTITECYKQHIVQVHNRESPGKKWTVFDECPKDVEQLLDSLGRLAYNGMMTTPSTFVFTEEDVKLAVKGTSLDKSAFKGLLHEHPSTSVFISKSTFNFTHTTQQELFSAYCIKHLPIGKQIDFLRTNISSPRFSMVLRFYAGLTQLADEKVVITLLHEPGFFDRPFLKQKRWNPFAKKSISALDKLTCDNEMPGLLQLFHFLYESQSSELTQSVARHLIGKSIIFNLFLTSYDSRVIAHCLRETPYLEMLYFSSGTPWAEHVLLCACSILMSESVTGIKRLDLRVDHLTQANGSLLNKGLARTAVEDLTLFMDSADMSAVAVIFQAPGSKSIDLHVYGDVHHGGDSDREVAQSLARNTSIKKLEVWSSPSLLLPVVKGLATNTCVEKLVLLSWRGDDGGVGQALATACTTNTTLKEIELHQVSPFPLMKALASRQVPLKRLHINAHRPNEDPNPCTLEALAQNMKVKRFEWWIISWTIEEAKPFTDGLSGNKFLEYIEVEVSFLDDNVKNYVTTKLSSLKKVHVRIQ